MTLCAYMEYIHASVYIFNANIIIVCDARVLVCIPYMSVCARNKSCY